jgi:hypothetical protein
MISGHDLLGHADRRVDVGDFADLDRTTTIVQDQEFKESTIGRRTVATTPHDETWARV